jgi:hypothetical protein
MDLTSIEAMADLMARHGLTRLTVGDVTLERPASSRAPGMERNSPEESATDKALAGDASVLCSCGHPAWQHMRGNCSGGLCNPAECSVLATGG